MNRIRWVLLMGIVAMFATASPAQRKSVSVRFTFKSDAYRQAYAPDPEKVERRVAERLLETCAADRYLRYWQWQVAGDVGAPWPADLRSDGIWISLVEEDEVPFVQLEIVSRFLSGLTTEGGPWRERLYPPGDADLTSLEGSPLRSQVAGVVAAALERLLGLPENRRQVFTRTRGGLIMGDFRGELRLAANGDVARFVLPVEYEDTALCLLRASLFELRCDSADHADVRLYSRGNDTARPVPAPTAPAPPAASERAAGERALGLGVNHEKIRLSAAPDSETAFDPQTHGPILRTLVPRIFFLRELNEDWHRCHTAGGVAIAP